MSAYIITHDSPLRGSVRPPKLLIEEKEKTPDWYFQNLNYVLSFYNRPLDNISFPSANTANARANIFSDYAKKQYPVQFKLRMIAYYMGEQTNLSYNHLTQNVSSSNLQAQFIPGQDVSQFVNYFRGIMMNRLVGAKFGAEALGKDAISKYDAFYNALLLKFDFKDIFERMSKKGMEFNPAGIQDFDSPEKIKKWMDTNYKEFGAITMSNLANGIWTEGEWMHKALQNFMFCVICSDCAFEHCVSNGKSHMNVVPSYQLITDTRRDDDNGRYDQFIGRIEPLSLTEILSDSRFNDLDAEQSADLEQMVYDNSYGAKYNISDNVSWLNYGNANSEGMLSVATVYFRGLRDSGKKKSKSIVGKEYISENNYGDKDSYKVQDVYRARIIANKYLVDFGPVDNIVEHFIDKSLPCFPIQRFQPNMFMGKSISEVARIFRIQDELDMYDYKIRELVGDSKGKVYMINGAKYDTTPKEFFDNVSSMRIHVAQPSGEAGDQTNSEKGVEVIDWTLDPNIMAFANLYKEKKQRMGEIMSASDITRGQQTKYVGLGVLQSTISQSSYGVAYLVDGYLDFLVRNMRYAANQQKQLNASKENKSVSMLIGDRGIKFLKFTKDMLWEDFNIYLTINNLLDEQKKERIANIAQRDTGLSTSDYIKIETTPSIIEITEHLEYRENQKKMDSAKQQQEQMQFQQKIQEMEKFWTSQLAQLKEDSANFRTIYNANMQAATKGIADILNRMPQQPTESQINQPQPQPQS